MGSVPSLRADSGLTLTSAGVLTLSGYSKEDYSGITWMGGDRYAIISDKKDGYYEATISLNSGTGSPTGWVRGVFHGSPTTSRDCEGIVYHSQGGTFFISGEADQRVLEYNADGSKTGRELTVPSMFGTGNGTGNYGFESLGYSAVTGKFWTTTESTLARDGTQAGYGNRINNVLRLQSFDETLSVAGQFAYRMDVPAATSNPGKAYAFGVPEILALPDGQLLVMEREFYATSFGLGSWVASKIYVVDPSQAFDVSEMESLEGIADEIFLEKELLWETKTQFLAGLANYEGMCLGPQLEDGSWAILLINDAQSDTSGLLGEYVQVLRLQGLVVPPAPNVPEPSEIAALAGVAALLVVMYYRRFIMGRNSA